MPLPDQQGRADILAVHLRQRPLALSIGDKPALCQTVARMTRGEAPGLQGLGLDVRAHDRGHGAAAAEP